MRKIIYLASEEYSYDFLFHFGKKDMFYCLLKKELTFS